MKKALINFAAILAGLFVILSLLDARGDYAAERIIWHANQKLNKVTRSPEAIPDREYDRIAASYKKVIDKFPKSKLAPGAHLLLGQTYIVKKSYDKARQIFRGTCPKYPENENLCAQAAISIGKTYEIQDNWTEALKTYKKLVKDYPLTDGGLTTPLHVARYYKKEEKPREARDAYGKAIIHYKKLITENPNSLVEFKVLGVLSSAYIDTEKWQEALDTLSKSLMKYPMPQTAAPILKSINIIALGKLQDKDLAIKLYQDIINQKPNHPLARHLRRVIESIRTLKDSNINIMLKEK